MDQVSSVIIQKLKVTNGVTTVCTLPLQSKHKAIAALFSYAVRLEQRGQQAMIDAILHAARTSKLVFRWRHTRTHISAIFDGSTPPSLDLLIISASPYIPWDHLSNTSSAIARWAEATSAVPYSEEVCQSVFNTLLRMFCNDHLQSHIPADAWAWLKKRPPLPPVYQERPSGSLPDIVSHVRGLEDIEILKSYFLLVWSEWDLLSTGGLEEMEI